MLTVLSIAFCGSGLAFLVAGLLPLLGGRAARSWPRTDGTIVAYDVAWRDVVGAGDAVEVVPMGRVNVTYDYAVAGASRRGTRVRLRDPKLRHARECDALAARFPVGAKVDVFYDPADPTRAVLDRSSGFGFVGVVFLLLGAALLAGGITLVVLG
ncbi:MAG: DUF3592 domain-containing protein [Planctomycetota bacterium]